MSARWTDFHESIHTWPPQFSQHFLRFPKQIPLDLSWYIYLYFYYLNSHETIASQRKIFHKFKGTLRVVLNKYWSDQDRVVVVGMCHVYQYWNSLPAWKVSRVSVTWWMVCRRAFNDYLGVKDYLWKVEIKQWGHNQCRVVEKVFYSDWVTVCSIFFVVILMVLFFCLYSLSFISA